ncbi:sugar kinase [Bryobacterales bacterium F-183]|nr:sugar kinase [Bryobacterales bacterium F-183]
MAFGIPGRILVTGNLVQDTVVYPADRIPDSGTQWVEHIEPYLGGNGASTSYAIGILGGHVRFKGMCGTDAAGGAIVARLRSVGVDLSALLVSDAYATAASVALVRTGGSRGFLHVPGSSLVALGDFAGFTSAELDGCTHYHLANPFALRAFRPHTAKALAGAKAAGLTTSMDTAWDSRGEWMQVVEPCLPHCDLLFANEDEIRMLTGHGEPGRAVQAFRDAGAKHVVVKLGAAGSVTFVQGQDEPLATPGFAIAAKDTTGAGDSFCGGFLAGMQRGLPLAEVARLANACGALSATSFGATQGLRDFAGTHEWISGTLVS